jgi:hypothetical protein
MLDLALLVQTDYRTEQNRSSRCTTSSTGTLIKDECSRTNHIEQLFVYMHVQFAAAPAEHPCAKLL